MPDDMTSTTGALLRFPLMQSGVSSNAALAEVRSCLVDREIKPGGRLPRERLSSCADLGLTCAEWCLALQVRETERRLRRCVGGSRL